MRKNKQDMLLDIIAAAGEYTTRNVQTLQTKALILSDFVMILAKGTKYEGDAKEIVEVLGFMDKQNNISPQ